jgi:multiple sugar transport system substrate-binding protein
MIGSRSRVLALLAAASAASLLAACGGSSGGGSATSSKDFGVNATGTVHFWARQATQGPAKFLVKQFNDTHKNLKVVLHLTPPNDDTSQLATAIRAGSVPDVVGLNDIDVPQFAHQNALMDVTKYVNALPFKSALSPGHLKLATIGSTYYGVPYLADLSVLWYNKALFKKAGLDAEKPPTTSGEIVSAARKIRALGPEVYGFYFSGSCPGCNIFTIAPQMWAARGTVVLPAGCDAEPLQGESIKQVLQDYRTMWKEGLIPEKAKADPGDHTSAVFMSGKVGMQAAANYAVALMKEKAPSLDFGVAFLPGPTRGDVSSFAGGDVLTIPAASKHPAKALEVLNWVMTDDPQLEVYAKTGNLPSRTDLAKNKYFAADPRLTKTAEALAVAQTPWTFHFNDMSNDNSSPWIEMLQTAIFEGDIDGAIAKAKKRMKQIQCD